MPSMNARGPGPSPQRDQVGSVFLGDVYRRQTALVRSKIDDMRKANKLEELLAEVEPRTGLTALHIAIGRNDLETTKVLVEAGARFIPDGQGRMPSYIAAEMEVSEELMDYVGEAEERALEAEKPEDV